ncbi:thermonuclease family protein [Sphingomonas pokkalii]|uniref:Nuclease n=1 Tax=Sphingomonas pokkalii TaxID=2175090 RepID=A0A2U0SHX2_9SPHN|nr:thermonuclease family protein [Sphingomonas pokkalii]PVX30950.1 nuclease [Sphingomonas pokkalii]
MMILAAACVLIAIDGDTLRCGRERIRLVGIDAPELPGHCRRGRRCVSGDPWQAKTALTLAIRGQAEIRRFGFDRYGRTLASVRVNGRDLSCHQITTGNASYVARWDPAHVIFATCTKSIGLSRP